MQPHLATAPDLPAPVLFNPWKHHAGALRCRIAQVAADGPQALTRLPGELLVLGTELMDLYTGVLSPLQIAEAVIENLRATCVLDEEPYRAWVLTQGGYRVLDLGEDGSRWVLRLGEEQGRHVHVHPGRWTPHTRRVRANVLRTAVMVLAWTGVNNGDPTDLALVNRVRREYLGLSPIRQLADHGGLPAVIALLRGDG